MLYATDGVSDMRHVDLCSGIGGFALGFEWAGLSSPVLFCDNELWCRRVLAKHWPHVPVAEDVRELATDARRLVPDCDILTAGYPCQPFSAAGKQRGEEDDRHIWPEIFTIVKAKLPRWCVFENVYGHISLGLDQVLSDLEGQGYACQAFVVPACAVDAPHRRDRVWIVANADNTGQPASSGRGQDDRDKEGHDSGRVCENVGHAQDDRRDRRATQARREGAPDQSDKPRLGVRGESSGSSSDVADTNGQRGRSGYSRGQDAKTARQPPRHSGHDARGMETWLPEPPVGRVANGIPRRVDRLKGLGNAIVPQIAQRIGETIKAVDL